MSELKIDYGSRISSLFKKQGQEFVFLLVGVDKSSQTKDIKLALGLARHL